MVYKTVRLPNGQKAELDWLRENDLPEVVETLNSVIREGKYLFMNDEITNLEEERRWFEKGTRDGMCYLVARVDGKVVGGASVHPRTQKSAHVADYGIYLRDGYRNLGLGTTLTKELVKIATKQGLEILQLSVYGTNDRASHVYHKCGFRECGRLTRDVKFHDGTYTDRILMELLLREA